MNPLKMKKREKKKYIIYKLCKNNAFFPSFMNKNCSENLSENNQLVFQSKNQSLKDAGATE